MIYLDNAATSFPKAPGVVEAVTDCLERVGGNPQRAGHALSLAASRIVYDTRTRLAALLSAPDPSRIVFTANATDALNTALRGVLRAITSSRHPSSTTPSRVRSGRSRRRVWS
jgi:selenocysteine lyase/cysteine desulfurase